MLTSTIDQQLILNNWLSFIIGSAANSLLLWLICYRTPIELRIYSRILAQAALLDTATLIATQLFQPLLLSRGGYSITNGLGWAVLDPQGGEFNRQWNILLYEARLFAWYSTFFSTALSFYYRYEVICRGGKLSMGRYIIGLLITCSMGLAVAVAYGAATEVGAKYLSSVQTVFTPEETRWLVSFTTPEMAAYETPILRANISLYFVTYAVIGYFCARIWLHVRTQTSHIHTARARAINRQVTIALMAQALTPFVLVICPTIYLLVANFFGSPQGDNHTLTFLLSWLPVIDGLSALTVIRPYRRTVLRALRLASPPTVEPIMVVPTTVCNTQMRITT